MRMDTSLILQNNHETMVDEEEELGSMSSSSENLLVSLDSMDDATSSTSSSSLSNKDDQFEDGPLYEMSSLIAQLPFKSRGLSKCYDGKCKSFTSLSNVRSLKDLAKPERLYRKKVSLSKCYGGSLGGQKSLSPNWCSKTITKKVSRGSKFSPSARNSPFILPRKSSNFF